MRKNIASQYISAVLINKTDGSPVTSGTTNVFISKSGAAQAAGGNTTATHKGNGEWEYACTQADTNGNHLVFTFVNSSAVNSVINVETTAADPADAVRFGLTALPNAIAGAYNGLPLSNGTKFYNADGSNGDGSFADPFNLISDAITGSPAGNDINALADTTEAAKVTLANRKLLGFNGVKRMWSASVASEMLELTGGAVLKDMIVNNTNTGSGAYVLKVSGSDILIEDCTISGKEAAGVAIYIDNNTIGGLIRLRRVILPHKNTYNSLLYVYQAPSMEIDSCYFSDGIANLNIYYEAIIKNSFIGAAGITVGPALLYIENTIIVGNVTVSGSNKVDMRNVSILGDLSIPDASGILTDVHVSGTLTYGSGIKVRTTADNLTLAKDSTVAKDATVAKDSTVAKASVLGSPLGASVAADVLSVKNETATIKAKTDLLFATVAPVTLTANQTYVGRTFSGDNTIELSGTDPINLTIEQGSGYLYIENNCQGNVNIVVNGFIGTIEIYGNVTYNVVNFNSRGHIGLLHLNHQVLNVYMYGCFGYFYGSEATDSLTIQGGGGHQNITAPGTVSIVGFIEGATLDDVKEDTTDILADIAALNDLSSVDAQAACASALAAYNTTGVAKEASVLGIQNNTSFVASIPEYMLIPTSSQNVYKLRVMLYDEHGDMEDPDDGDFGIKARAVVGDVDKNGILYQEYACSNLLDASGISGYKSLVRIDTGVYECFVKIASTETVTQFMYDFAIDETNSSITLRKYFTRTNLVLEANPATVDANVVSIANDAITAASIADDAITAIQNGLATEANVDTAISDIGDVDTAVGNLQTSVNDLPTNSELATALSPIATETDATANKEEILAAVEAGADPQTIRDAMQLSPTTSSVLPEPDSIDSKLDALSSYVTSIDDTMENVLVPNWYVSKTGSSGADGKSWATAKDTIANGIALLGEKGTLHVGEGTWAEEFTLPAYCRMVGYGECFIRGALISTGPTATLSEGSVLERVQLGKQNADAGALYIVHMERDSMLTNIQHRNFAFAELGLLAFVYVPNGQVTIENCFLSGNAGSPTPITIITGQLRSSHIRGNFLQTPADVITIDGTSSGREDMIDISNNFFRSGAGSYCVKFIGTVGGANPGRVSLVNNRWSGADAFRSGGNNVLEVDNIFIAEDTQAIWDALTSGFLTPQQIRDAMQLSPTTSSVLPEPASIDAKLDALPQAVWEVTGLDALDENMAGKMLWKSMAIHFLPFRTWHPSWKDGVGVNTIWIQLFDDSGVYTEPHVLYEARAFTKDGVTNPVLSAADLSIRNEIAPV